MTTVLKLQESESFPRGYAYDFTDPPPNSLECSICMDVFSIPNLTSCCGNHFCESCIAQVMLASKSCPLCNQSEFTVFHDKGVQRRVNALSVHCVNRDLGCSWVGELGRLQDHLYPKGKLKGDCKYVVVECSQGCGRRVQRRFVRSHQMKQCICRSYSCDYCEYGSTYEDIRRNHWPVCPNFPVRCPNQCETKTITQSYIDKHLTEECPMAKVKCEFSYAGCKARVRRKDMAAHMQENFSQHLSQLSAVNLCLLKRTEQKKQLALLKQQNQELKREITQLKETRSKEKEVFESKITSLGSQMASVTPFSFTMTNFESCRKSRFRWFSPFFYSHPSGYRMCIRVDASGIMLGSGTHVSVLVHFAQGLYDDQLRWPFRGNVTIQLLKQKSDGEPYEITIPFIKSTSESTASRVEVGSMATWGWGCYTFIPHEDLRHEYLLNDCLQFSVSRVDVL